MPAAHPAGSGHNGHSGQNGGYVREPMGVQASASDVPMVGDYAEDIPFPRPPEQPMPRQQLTDLDIPTFIRRQMD